MVEFLDRILPGMDSEVCRQFQRLLEKQGITFKLVVEGHRRRGVGKEAQGHGRAGRRRRGGNDRRRCRAGVDRSRALHRRARARGGRREDRRQGPRDRRRALRHQRAGHLRHRRRDRRPDAGAQGGGRRRGGGGNPRRPGRPRELRRHSERRLHLSGGRLGREERGRIESRPASPTRSASFPSRPMAAPRSICRPRVS